MYPCSPITSERILHAFVPSMWAVLILYFGTGVHETQGSGLLLSFERVSHVTLAKSLCCIWTSLWTSSCGMLNERSNPGSLQSKRLSWVRMLRQEDHKVSLFSNNQNQKKTKTHKGLIPPWWRILQNPLISSGYWAHTHVLMFAGEHTLYVHMRASPVWVHLPVHICIQTSACVSS